jgi:hypothetical protein
MQRTAVSNSYDPAQHNSWTWNLGLQPASSDLFWSLITLSETTTSPGKHASPSALEETTYSSTVCGQISPALDKNSDLIEGGKILPRPGEGGSDCWADTACGKITTHSILCGNWLWAKANKLPSEKQLTKKLNSSSLFCLWVERAGSCPHTSSSWDKTEIPSTKTSWPRLPIPPRKAWV